MERKSLQNALLTASTELSESLLLLFFSGGGDGLLLDERRSLFTAFSSASESESTSCLICRGRMIRGDGMG